ncbi:MAG: hypothetical protein H6602_01070 [Flavobacteriales bacterium]|nr:hypothetical protein [Flavobacteriales bacterium]
MRISSFYSPNEGRPKSALEVVQKIHDQAVKDGNGAQLVKAVIHEIKFQSEFEEESLVASIIRLEGEAKTAPEPTKQILHSLLAEMNWGYYQNNSWQIHNRTATEAAGRQHPYVGFQAHCPRSRQTLSAFAGERRSVESRFAEGL